MDEKEKENMRPYAYFEKFLNSIDYKLVTALTEHYKFLLLAMLVYQPPLRTGFYQSAMFLRSTKNNNGINNYVHISYQGSSKTNQIIKSLIAKLIYFKSSL